MIRVSVVRVMVSLKDGDNLNMKLGLAIDTTQYLFHWTKFPL